DPARDAGRVPRVGALLMVAAAGDGAAGVSRGRVASAPVRRAFPTIADHVVQAVPVGGERADRRGSLIPVIAGVQDGELALPGIGHPFAAGVELVSPGELGAVQPAAGGQLPLGFGGDGLTRPVRVRGDVRPADMHPRLAWLVPTRPPGPLWVRPAPPGYG